MLRHAATTLSPSRISSSQAARDLQSNMKVPLHPQALERLVERGATEEEAAVTVESGERFPARFGRTGFRRNFAFNDEWMGRRYATKQVEA